MCLSIQAENQTCQLLSQPISDREMKFEKKIGLTVNKSRKMRINISSAIVQKREMNMQNENTLPLPLKVFMRQ